MYGIQCKPSELFYLSVNTWCIYTGVYIKPSVRVKGEANCKTSYVQGEVWKAVSWQIFFLVICSLTVNNYICPFSLLYVGTLATFPCCTGMNYSEMANFDMFVKKYELCLLCFPICFCPGRSRAQYIVLTRHIRQESPISPWLNSHDPVWHGQVNDETDSGLWNLCCYEAWMLLFRYALCLLSCKWNGTSYSAHWQPNTRDWRPFQNQHMPEKALG